MTEPNAAPAAPQQAGLFEDFIDIFASPARVFVRRATASPVAPYLLMCVLLIVLFWAGKNALSPVIDAQIQKAVDAASKNPQMTPEALAQMQKFGPIGFMVVGTVIAPIALLCVALVGWLLAKVFGGTISYGAALTVASFAYVPRLIGAIAVIVQGLVLDTSKWTSIHQFELSPARFFDPATSSPYLLSLLSRFDLMTLWVTALLAMGIVIIAKIPRQKIFAVAVAFWVIGLLPAMWQARSEAAAATAAAPAAQP